MCLAAIKTNLLVQVRDAAGRAAGYGEAAPNVRYGETPVGLQAEFAALLEADLGGVQTEAELPAKPRTLCSLCAGRDPASVRLLIPVAAAS